jgi:hypothetical protein
VALGNTTYEHHESGIPNINIMWLFLNILSMRDERYSKNINNNFGHVANK